MSSKDNSNVPQDAPPSYAVATGSSAATSHEVPMNSTHLEVPVQPVTSRKSMEDEVRPLPEGWIRQWDTKEQHQFFVDTKASPPRSIWVHPLDDEETLQSLSSEERERLQEEEGRMKHPSTPVPEKSDKSSSTVPHHEAYPADLPAQPSQSHVHEAQKKGFGERFKDKLTGTTHEEREQIRAERAVEEQKYYEMHARFRSALQRAATTGQPQFFAKDRDGRDIYIEPPSRPGYYGGRGGYGYGPQSYGYNPYSTGPYSSPNARFIRPNYAYGRPGYGTGLGLPIAGGLLGGALLGGLIF